MLRVRGDSMIDAGILDGDYVVVRQQPEAEKGDIVVAGHPRRRGHRQDVSRPAAARSCSPRPTQRLSPMEFDPAEVTIYGKVVTVLRRL